MILAGSSEKIYSVAKLAKIVDALREEGVPPAHALKGADLTEADLHSPDTRVSLDQMIECFRNADQLSPDRDFAFRTGLRFHVSTYGMYGFAILSSTNFRQACRFAEQYQRLEVPVADIGFNEEGDHAVWTITPAVLPGVDARLYKFIVDLQFGIAISLHRDVMGSSFAPQALQVAYGATKTMQNNETIFGCPVLFDQPRNALMFDRTWLDHPPALGNELSHLEAVRLCDELLKDMEVRIGLAGDVREVLFHNLARGLTIDAVSKRLGMPLRTLKRRLQRQGTSFSQIADELRAQVAIRYLRETQLTIEEIASCLGYSEASNFRQAFRRWTEKTPQQFRFPP